MDYTLTFEKREGYLYFYVTGRDSLEVSKAFWREIIETTLKLNYNKVLVDEDLEDTVSFGEIYDIITTGLEIPNIREISIAVVDRHIDQTNLNLFGAIVASNRGINTKIFTTLEDAEQWLRS